MKYILGLASFIVCLNLYAADAGKTINFKNQRGSTLSLTWVEDKNNAGSINGTFTTNVSRCKEDIGKPQPVLGYYTGNAVAITINYPNCASVVVMTGVLSQDKTELNMQWIVNRHVNDPVNENWDSFIIGMDNFKKQ